MKKSIKFVSICLLAGLLTAGVSFLKIPYLYSRTIQSTINVPGIADEDCYTYDRELINGVW